MNTSSSDSTASTTTTGASELWLKLVSGHISVQQSALHALQSDIKRLPKADPRRALLVSATLWRAVVAFNHRSLHIMASQACLDMTTKGILDTKEIMLLLLTATPSVPCYGIHIHPYIVAISKCPDMSQHIILAFCSDLEWLLTDNSNSAVTSDQSLIMQLMAHLPFIHYAMSISLHQPKPLPDLQRNLIDALLSIMQCIPPTFVVSGRYLSDIFMNHLAEFSHITQELVFTRVHRIWERNENMVDRSSIIQLLLDCVVQHWSKFRRVPCKTFAFLCAIVKAKTPFRIHSDWASILAVGSYILLSAFDSSTVLDIERLISCVFHCMDVHDSTLDPMFLSLLLPLHAISQVAGNLRSYHTCNDKSDISSLFESIMNRICHRSPGINSNKLVDEVDTGRIIFELQAAQVSANSVEYSQIIGFAIHSLTQTNPTLYCHTDTIPELSFLVLGAGLFNPTLDIRRMSLLYLADAIKDSHKSYLLKLFSAIVYILKGEKEPELVQMIVEKSIPMVAACNDPFVASASIRFALSSLSGSNLGTIVELTGLKSLIEIWNTQPRIWTHVKTYLFQWLHRFRDSCSGGRKKTVEELNIFQEIEISVIRTVRLLSKQKPEQCGYDLLPLIINYLHIPFSSTQGRAIALASISQAISDGISTPLAAWNVVMQKFVTTIKPDCDIVIIESLCRYYATVGEKMQLSEQYIAFSSEILRVHLVPLTLHEAPSVQSAAFQAFSAFPPSDIYPLLSHPMDFLSGQLENASLLSGVDTLFCRLIEHECNTMRRPVFKGLASTEGALVSSSAHDVRGDAQTTMRSRVKNMSCVLTEMYETGKFSSAARGGLAFATLFSPEKHDYTERILNFSKISSSQLSFYQISSSAVKDMVTTDFFLAKFEAVDAWRMFWRTSFGHTRRHTSDPDTEILPLEATESMFELLVDQKIDEQLQSNKAPAVISNLVLSVTGALLAAHDMSFISASNKATSFVDHCFNLMDTKHTRPDVISTLLVALSALPLVIHLNDDKRLERIIETMYIYRHQPVTLDEEQIVSLTADVGLAKIIHHILSSSTFLTQRGINAIVLRYIEAFDASLPWNIGLAMGWSGLASSSIAGDMIEIIGTSKMDHISTSAMSRINMYMKLALSSKISQQDEALFIASLWILSATLPYVPSIITGDEYLVSLDQFLKRIQKEKKMDQAIPHVLLAYNREFVRIQGFFSDDGQLAISELLNQSLLLCQSNSNSPIERQASLLALGPLLGLDYSFELDAHPSTLNLSRSFEAVEILHCLLVSRDDSKVLRLCGWVVGLILWTIGCALDSDGTHTVGRREPRHYHRLNSSSCFLRALHDQLVESVSKKDVRLSLQLVRVFSNVNAALPMADWSGLLTDLLDLHVSMRAPVLSLIRHQALRAPSKGFANVFIHQMGLISASVCATPDDTSDFGNDFLTYVCSADSITTLLQLGGVSNQAVAARASIEPVVSVSKVVDILKHVLQRFFVDVDDTCYDEAAECVMDTIRMSLPMESSRSPLHRDISRLALQMLNESTESVCTDTRARTLCHLVACVLTDSSCADLLVRQLDTYSANVTQRQFWVLGAVGFLSSSPSLVSRSNTRFIAAIRNAFSEGSADTLTACVHSLLSMVAMKTDVGVVLIVEWMSKILDVAILLVSSSSSLSEHARSSIDAVCAIWDYAIVGLVSLGWGSLRASTIQARPSAQPQNGDSKITGSLDLVLVPLEHWPLMRYESAHLLRGLLCEWQNGVDASDNTASAGVLKRLLSLRDCIEGGGSPRTLVTSKESSIESVQTLADQICHFMSRLSVQPRPLHMGCQR
ncbi:hypothetical protein BSLG_004908 [Batrachochytrium salamandrivorans]|nr:hypothetical protein BSLG_004908 [Batrachochytrium salamandrivorans]